MANPPFSIDLRTVCIGFDGETCLVDPWAGLAANGCTGVLTVQRLDLSGSDVFFGACNAVTADRGRTWSGFTPVRAMERVPAGEALESCVNDLKPHWHAKTGRMLGIGVRVYYRDGGKHPAHVEGGPGPETAWAVWDPPQQAWSAPRNLAIPGETGYESFVAGSVQRLDEPDGTILLPLYCGRAGQRDREVIVARCAFDGETLGVVETGPSISLPVERGLTEPSLARVGETYLLTLRNDEKGYAAVSKDGLRFGGIQPWRFDDGEELGNYNTQQHWVTHGGRAWLVYTRRGLGNDHVFRHRAPLMIAEVDIENLAVIRETETVLVPERGARLGNFGITRIDETETWVTVAEWMQPRGCERHGSDNTVYLAALRFS